jgi:hypothetical protein
VSWLEPRTLPAEDPPEDVTSAGRVVELVRWSIPLEVEGEISAVAGTTSWQPSGTSSATSAGTGVLPRVLVTTAVLSGLLAVALIARRRRGQGRGA